MAKKGRGRPRSTPVTATDFSVWLRQILDSHQIDERTAAARLGVTLVTIYDWLAGKDPRMAHLIKPGILDRMNEAKSLGTSARRSQDSPLAVNPTAPEADMSPDDRRAWEEFNQIVNARDNERRHDWRAIRGLLLGIAEDREQPRQRAREKPDARPARRVQ